MPGGGCGGEGLVITAARAGAFEIAGELLHNTDIFQCGYVFTGPALCYGNALFPAALLNRLKSSLRCPTSGSRRQHSSRALAVTTFDFRAPVSAASATCLSIAEFLRTPPSWALLNLSTLDRCKCDSDTEADQMRGTREIEQMHQSRTVSSSQRTKEHGQRSMRRQHRGSDGCWQPADAGTVSAHSCWQPADSGR
jgi:hypothetical protein